MTTYEIVATALNIAILLIVGTAFYWRGRMPVQKTVLDQPVTVREHREATWAEVAAIERRVSALEARMSAALDEFREDVIELHKKIDAHQDHAAGRHSEVMRALGRLEGKP